jgi:chloramphenicol O-acetyltransferase type B
MLMKNAPDGYKSAGDTEIGHDVWIGAEAMILPGIKVGHGSVIGARSVVTKDVQPYSIIAGNPAKIIRMRFKDDQIKKLLELKWWDWSEKQLASAMNLLCSEEIDKLYNYWTTLKQRN